MLAAHARSNSDASSSEPLFTTRTTEGVDQPVIRNWHSENSHTIVRAEISARPRWFSRLPHDWGRAAGQADLSHDHWWLGPQARAG